MRKVTDRDWSVALKCHGISKEYQFCTTGNLHEHKLANLISAHVEAECNKVIIEFCDELIGGIDFAQNKRVRPERNKMESALLMQERMLRGIVLKARDIFLKPTPPEQEGE